MDGGDGHAAFVRPFVCMNHRLDKVSVPAVRYYVRSAEKGLHFEPALQHHFSSATE